MERIGLAKGSHKVKNLTNMLMGNVYELLA